MAASKYRLRRCCHGLAFGTCEAANCEGAAGKLAEGVVHRVQPKKCANCKQSKGDVARRDMGAYLQNMCESCWELHEKAVKFEAENPGVPGYRERRRA